MSEPDKALAISFLLSLHGPFLVVEVIDSCLTVVIYYYSLD